MGQTASELERQLAEAEKRRQIAEQLRSEAPSLAEKLKAVEEQLSATESVLEKAELLVDGLVSRSREVHEQESVLYRRLLEIAPKVVAEIKKE